MHYSVHCVCVCVCRVWILFVQSAQAVGVRAVGSLGAAKWGVNSCCGGFFLHTLNTVASTFESDAANLIRLNQTSFFSTYIHKCQKYYIIQYTLVYVELIFFFIYFCCCCKCSLEIVLHFFLIIYKALNHMNKNYQRHLYL